MDFRTIIKIPSYPFSISYSDKIMIIGSCFAENIGRKLSENKFDVVVNPFGVLYNPMSIKSALTDIITGKNFTEEDLFTNEGLYHSFSHHSRFSATKPEICLENINQSLENARTYIDNLDYLIITFGTAYIYRLKESGNIVSNCHKLPDKLFERERLGIDEIVSEYIQLIQQLREKSPALKILFTVSPIRHLKDGAHKNQLSKSILLLAVEQLQNSIDDIYYFPAYEIVMDELRDYRFYAEDMCHISDTTVSYLWEQFTAAFVSEEMKLFIRRWGKIKKAMQHSPFNPDSESYKLFMQKTIEELEMLKREYSKLNLDCFALTN